MATMTLFPTGAGSVHVVGLAGIIGNYTALDDYSESDYVYVYGAQNLSDSGRDSYTLQDTALSGAITNVRLYTRLKIWVGFGGSCSSLLYTHNTEYLYLKGNAQYLDWTTFTDDFAVNPYTGSAWTWQEINNLQAGCSLATAKAGGTIADSYMLL